MNNIIRIYILSESELVPKQRTQHEISRKHIAEEQMASMLLGIELSANQINGETDTNIRHDHFLLDDWNNSK